MEQTCRKTGIAESLKRSLKSSNVCILKCIICRIFLLKKQAAIKKGCSQILREFRQSCRIRFQANSMFTLEKVLLRFKPTISSTINHHTFPPATDLLNFSASASSRNIKLETGKQKLNSSCLREKKKIKTVFTRS